MSRKISKAMREYFQEIGRTGGKIGGKRSLETMTPEQRSARASKAIKARWSKRPQKPIPAPEDVQGHS